MTTSDDLRATIARLRGSVERNAVYGYRDLVIEDDDLTAILDAAERALTARNAALEEAADIIDDSRGEVEDDDGGRSAAVDEHCTFLAANIRALKEPT